MKLDIPLDSAVMITIDPVRKVLSITDEQKPGPSPGSVASFHVWNAADGHARTQEQSGRDAPQRLALPTAATLAGKLRTRKLAWAGSLAGVCLLGFVYARQSGPSTHPAMQEAPTAQQLPPSIQIPSPPRAGATPPMATASPNAAFGLD